MKRKLLFAAILIAGALGFNVNAQEDITSTYLTNADLSTVDNGWTYYSNDYKFQQWRTGDASKSAAVEFYAGWGSLEHTNFKFSQTITLPAGDYRIAVNAFYREGNGGNGTNANKAWIFAGDVKQNVYALNGMSAVSAYDAGGDDMDDAMHAFKAGAFSNAFDFSLAEETEISLGFQGLFDSMKSWCILGPVKLYKYSLDDYLVDYDAKYAEADAIDDQIMNADVKSALTSAMVDRSSFSLSSEVTAAIATLTTAINNANNSIAAYTSLKSYMDAVDAKTSLLDSYGVDAYSSAAADAKNAYTNRTATDGAAQKAALDAAFNAGVLATKQPGNGLDMTAYITNSNFDSGNTTGWTLVTPYGGNCTIQGGSRMEYWAGNASSRLDASFNIYQELSNLPSGAYTVSADMYNSLNGESAKDYWGNEESGDHPAFAPTCGVYGVSNNEEVALVTAEGDVLNTYTTGEILVFRGKMTIGTKNTVTPIIARWFLFDNVKLTYARQLTQEEIDANTVPESISLDETSVDMTIYDTQTLTATILPDNANDKTITWSSSNEAVATVSNGLVTAVGVGTATITATANGADDVEATATITVSDVTPVSAPAYYSTEIVDGTDYYIVNAATGQFLGGANDWGTRASLIEHGIPFGAAKISDGVYTLDSYTYNSQTSHYVNGTYVDGAATNLFITSLGNGKFTISTADGSAFMTAKPVTTVVANTAVNASSTLAQWYFLSKNDRDKALAVASAENPTDATYYVKQANISRNRSAGGYNVNAWSQYSDGGTQDNTNYAAQVYNAAVDNYQTIENIPNGTYQVTVQAFTSGTDVKFYANDQKVAVRNNDSGVANCSAAAALFAQGLYPNTVTVTVTDRTLKIGFEGDCSGAKWLCYDDVTLYMTGYTANTGVSAENLELQIGQNVAIGATTVPATASFNALTYASADESIATVDANGFVTGVAVGNTTITVTANEMENFSTTVDVTVTLVTPTAFNLSETEVALDKETTAATLTITPTPDGANNAATWTSSDESVATVVDGVVTAVSTGTATITATSVVDAEVSATANVTVMLPETAAPANYYVNNDATRTVYTLGENLIKNGTFEYPDGFYGWTDATVGAAKLSSSKFEIVTDGDTKYLKAKASEGSTAEGSIGTAWSIESGKTYVFGYRVKASKTIGDKSKYHKLTLTNALGTETAQVSDDNTPVTNTWSNVQYTFTNTGEYAFVQFRARWLGNDMSFDDFYLAEVTPATEGNVDYATAAIPTANIGTGAFQYSQAAIDAANALVQGEATVEDVENAYDALTTLNAPAAGKLYNVVNVSDGYNHKGKAVTFKSASNADLSGNTTSFGYNENPGSIYPQGFKFTAVDGVKNGYKLSYTRADGNEVFVGTGSSTTLGSNNDQIRPTTDASKAVTVQVVATTTENVWNLYNTLASKNIGANGANDQGFYTVASYNSMKIQEAVNNEVSLNILAENQYGTLILPFNADVPTGVTAYSVEEATGSKLTLVGEDAFEANIPYIVFAESGATATLEGLGSAYTDANYTEGLLTGVYAATLAPVDSYVLQNNENKVGFYRVEAGAEPTVGANRAYLTVPAGVKADAFFFDEGTATAIKSVFDGVAAGEVYDLAGRKLQKLQKGVNIVNGKKVLVK